MSQSDRGVTGVHGMLRGTSGVVRYSPVLEKRGRPSADRPASSRTRSPSEGGYRDLCAAAGNGTLTTLYHLTGHPRMCFGERVGWGCRKSRLERRGFERKTDRVACQPCRRGPGKSPTVCQIAHAPRSDKRWPCPIILRLAIFSRSLPYGRSAAQWSPPFGMPSHWRKGAAIA
jgi:hypothetical protein